MGINMTAFQQPIQEGLIRILLRVSEIECEIENDAPDFVFPIMDHPKLKLNAESDLSGITDVFNKDYELKVKEAETGRHTLTLEMAEGGVWFDIEMEKVKDVWLSDYQFYVESEKPRYLKYFIKNVKHELEWLQYNPLNNTIQSLSNIKKAFSVPAVSMKDSFTGSEIMMCVDMISKAIHKIDVRFGSAMVKLNTDKPNIESLLIGVAERLGYLIEPLEEEIITKEKSKGNSVSHIIQLKCLAHKSKN